ncbi:MAG: DUF3656 domain-containing protein [Bacillota bacterium]|nr:DUF3656 domain-containing protein [Bacillota bacterium]
MTELLAPAGGFDSLKAAIANGANAVYMGGKAFSARASAENFSLEELAEAVRCAHFYGVRVYAAVNTLIADSELAAALEYVDQLQALGVDAVIVQDAGLLMLLHRLFPALPLHASTQMSVHNSCGVQAAAEQGAGRVILARELSFADLELLRARTQVPLEVFLHGALCVCYSGQCLFSSLIGGRSGNRGRCAQPCRMAYKLVDEHGEVVPTAASGNYLLSPRDLFGYRQLERLHQLGLAAWKIEGRMKRPEYVATVCRVYAKMLRLLDERRIIYPQDEDMRELLQAFNRDQCSGYWLGNAGASLMSYSRPNNRGLLLGRVTQARQGMLSIKLSQPLALGDGIEIWLRGSREGLTVSKIIADGAETDSAAAGQLVQIPAAFGHAGDRVFKTFDAPLNQRARDSYRQLPAKRVDMTITARLGQPLRLSAVDEDGYQARLDSDYVVEQARTSCSDLRAARAQLARLGGSGYQLGELDGQLDKDIILPASVLNDCRRRLIAQLTEQRVPGGTRPRLAPRQLRAALAAYGAAADGKAAPSVHLTALVDTPEQALLAVDCGCADIYYDVSARGGGDVGELARRLTAQGAALAVYLPQIIAEQQLDAWRRRIGVWREQPLAAAVANNIGQARLLLDSGWRQAIYGGAALNVYNSASCEFYREQGLTRLCLSPELTLEQLRGIDAGGVQRELAVLGAQQLMISEYCALGALLGGRDAGKKCSAPCREARRYALRDDKNYSFPIRVDADCRMHVYNSRQLCLLEELERLTAAGIGSMLLDLRLYQPQQARRLLELFRMALFDSFGLAEAVAKLPQVLQDYTKGHLYRGV